MVTGPMVRAFDVAARKTYEAMPGPRSWSRPARARSAASTRRTRSYTVTVGEALPVDVWIPGCPPSPLALLQGLWWRWTGSPRRCRT